MNTPNWLYIAMNFAIVLALLIGVLYVLKRMQGGNLLGMQNRKIKVLEMVSVAPRQKVVLLRVKDQDKTNERPREDQKDQKTNRRTRDHGLLVFLVLFGFPQQQLIIRL